MEQTTDMAKAERACIARIEQALWENGSGRVAVGIDGRCGAGKSTFTERLAEHFDAPVVHMDHFFLPNELRSEARRLEAGGNVHYERFLREVAPFLRTRDAFSYGIFDCRVRRITEQATMKQSKLILVEGAYALHPLLCPLYDIRLFVTVDADTQRQRIQKRNGAAMLARFVDEWIPLEEAYIAACNVSACCDLVIDTAR